MVTIEIWVVLDKVESDPIDLGLVESRFLLSPGHLYCVRDLFGGFEILSFDGAIVRNDDDDFVAFLDELFA